MGNNPEPILWKSKKYKIIVGFILFLYLDYWVYVFFAPELSHVNFSVKFTSMITVFISGYIFYRVWIKRVQRMILQLGYEDSYSDIYRVEGLYAFGISLLVYDILSFFVAESLGGIVTPIPPKWYNKPLYVPREQLNGFFIWFAIVGIFLFILYPLYAHWWYECRDD